jgi:uncharacterized protein
MKKKWFKRFLWAVLLGFILMNAIACMHAYRFTHFSSKQSLRTADPKHLDLFDKLKTLLTGISNPKPVNLYQPDRAFETIILPTSEKTECWLIKADSSRGTVILCHGYLGNKSSMLDKAYILQDAGYHTLLLDFMGSGGSEGHRTSIGFYEAEQVKAAYDFVKASGETNIVLIGVSMGAVAIMKAQNDYQFKGSSLILECPFGTMLKTVQARFKAMGLPCFPMDRLLTFWGGKINGFNAFEHNPEEYAKGIGCRTLLMYGEKDERVSRIETDCIFSNLKGYKRLKLYPLAGHENYLNKYKIEWTEDVLTFLDFSNENTN